jgi:cation diffusion facilitator family transporter
MDTFRGIRKVLWLTMGLNLIATAAKLIVGFMTGSLSLIADGFDSVFDSASNVVGLVGIRVAERPADEGHPYGHRKAETLTALIVAGLLFLTTWELLKSAIERLRNPSLIHAEVNIWSFAALLLSIAIHSLVVWYETREGKRLGSDFLVADALHTRADIFVSLSVIGGLIAVKLGFPIADPLLALVIALVIAKIGIDIIRESSPILMDGAAMPPDEMVQTALSVPGVVSSHRVRSRGHEGAVYADLHIRVDPAMSTEQAHAIAHEVQNRLREKHKDILDVTVHVEPADSPAAQHGPNGITTRLRRLADGLGITVHDIWAREVKGQYYVEVHLEADGRLSLREAHDLASALEERARQELPNLSELTAHIEPHGQVTQAPAPDSQEAQIAASVQRLVDSTLAGGTCHKVFVQREGDGWSVSLHCRLPGDLKLEEAHRTSTMLEAKLRREIKGLERVIIHTEPEEAE